MDIKQIVTTMILFVLMSISLTTEKTTLVWSLHILQQPDTDIITGYSILLIILGGPYLFSLLQILWNVPFIANSKDPQFPGIGNVLLGCIVCSIEAACLVFFAVEVAPIFPVFLFLPILNSVLLIPTFVEEVQKLREQSTQKIDILGTFHWRSRYQKRLQVFACIIACFLPVVLAVSLYSWNRITDNQAVVLGATIFGLSIVNCPVIQRYILAPKGRIGHKPKKITLFYTLYKIGALLLFLGIHFFNRVPERPDVTHTLTEFTEGFSNIIRPEIFLPLSLNYLSAMISHSLAFIALSWCLPVYGILLPSVLSVTAAIAVCCGFLEPDFFNGQKIGELNSLVVTSFITLFIWCAPYILTTSCWTKKPEYLFMPFEALFMSYSWNALFFDQYLLLSYKSESSVPEIGSETRFKSSAHTKSRIFVCTTMYREADYEMDRLLMSLQGLSSSKKFNNVYLEAHIFMDNGCTGGTLSSFAQQLVELVEIKLGLSIQNGACLEMPYGIQILWTLNDGMPLTVHFKDSQKVKSKKRWSQAMYVHYILNFKLQKPSLEGCDSSTASSRCSDQKVSHDMMTNLSYEEIKRRSLVLDRYTEMRKYVRERENQFEKWTDMFVVSERNFGHNISRIGYPTLMSNDRLLFDGQEKKIQDQGSPQRIQARSFLVSIPTDSTVTQASDSLPLSPVSSLTDEENDECDLIDDEISFQMRGKLSFENDAFIKEELNLLNQLECPRNRKCITGSLEKNIPEMVIHENSADNSKTDGNNQYSLKRSNNNYSISSQGMDSKAKIQENKDGNRFTVREKSPVLHSRPLLELRVDTLCVSASSEENNLTEKFQSVEDVGNDMINEDQIYILATDADMEFKDDAVLDLLHLCNNDRRVGAACGRTYPQGKKNEPIVWHQIFEYAKDFWMIKNAQNVIGSVMCCPGCFSLYRASAIRQVIDKYVTPTRTPFTVYVKDTGEDRWMATLMMVQGWYMRYSSSAGNNTFCPDTFEEFLKQRRRWVLSDIANAVLVIQNLWSLMRRNVCFSLCYVLYMLNMFLNNIITPGTAIVMITAGLDLVFGVPYLQTTLPLAAVLFAYSIICTQCSTRTQTHITAALTIIMGATFFAVVVWGSATIVRGIVQDIMIGNFHFQQHYIIMLITLSFGYAALMHPSESYIVFYGLAYVFIFPAMHILLPIYSIANIIDQSWGTRDTQKAKLTKIPSLFHCIKRKKKKYFPKVSDAKEATPNRITSELKHLKEGNAPYEEYNFWRNLRQSVIGTGVNIGLSKAELTKQLRRMRNWALFGILTINGLWLLMLSVFYMGITSSLSKLNIYGVISGALYGFTLVIQMLGITACRLDHIIRYVGNVVFGQRRPFWINCKE